jgi:hypothetical protein
MFFRELIREDFIPLTSGGIPSNENEIDTLYQEEVNEEKNWLRNSFFKTSEHGLILRSYFPFGGNFSGVVTTWFSL